MDKIKENNKDTKGNTLKCMLSPLFMAVLATFSLSCQAQDLAAGTELKDSSLSLSLTTKRQVTVDNQVSQLVISQYGIYNQATVNQMANSENTIIIFQNGINNLAHLSQTGYGNEINLEQLGNNNFAEVIQDGNANTANIKQAGEQTFTVHQIGNDMVVDITQYQLF